MQAENPIISWVSAFFIIQGLAFTIVSPRFERYIRWYQVLGNNGYHNGGDQHLHLGSKTVEIN
jgi:hypothetical protein